MNERIKKLAEQSGLIFVPPSVDYFGERHTGGILKDDLDVEKFAELIVKECMSMCQARADNLAQGSFRDGALLCQQDIKQHFGVEE